MRPPQVRTQSFLPSICYIYTICFRIVLGFGLFCNLTHIYMPDVISVRQTRSLPPASFRFLVARTPLLLAMCLALSTRTRDFHPLDCAHALLLIKSIIVFTYFSNIEKMPHIFLKIVIKLIY